jgi:hypothetical protein
MVVDRDPDLWALLGPNDVKEPGDLSPLSIAGFGRGGTLLKRSPKGKKKGAKAAPPAPATQLQLEEDGDPDAAADENDDADDADVEDGDDEENPDDVG